jgi:hypothetical protein
MRKRRDLRRHQGANGSTPEWMQPLPTGPVRFDPALRTAKELAGPGVRYVRPAISEKGSAEAPPRAA